MVSAHRDRGVTLEGYGPFKAADLCDLVHTAIAKDHGVTVPQVILRWHLEHGFVAILKSTDAGHIAERLRRFGFSLDGEVIARIDSLAG
jgi:2,5-diketo-D-gluconate reductase A